MPVTLSSELERRRNEEENTATEQKPSKYTPERRRELINEAKRFFLINDNAKKAMLRAKILEETNESPNA